MKKSVSLLMVACMISIALLLVGALSESVAMILTNGLVAIIWVLWSILIVLDDIRIALQQRKQHDA